jgi:hypothetical protein
MSTMLAVEGSFGRGGQLCEGLDGGLMGGPVDGRLTTYFVVKEW